MIKMLKKHLLFTLLFLTSLSFSQNKIIDISGKWSFEIDRNDVGVTEKWYSKQLVDNIYLPGSMAENRKGDNGPRVFMTALFSSIPAWQNSESLKT